MTDTAVPASVGTSTAVKPALPVGVPADAVGISDDGGLSKRILTAGDLAAPHAMHPGLAGPAVQRAETDHGGHGLVGVADPALALEASLERPQPLVATLLLELHSPLFRA